MNTSSVLYVEDNEDHAYLLRRAFEELGVGKSLTVVSDAETAIDYLCGQGAYGIRERHPLPAVVLLDINLPRISGLELLCWVRRRPQTHHIVVLMLTTSNHDADVAAAYRLGADGYILKNGRVEVAHAIARSVQAMLDHPAADRRSIAVESHVTWLGSNEAQALAPKLHD